MGNDSGPSVPPGPPGREALPAKISALWALGARRPPTTQTVHLTKKELSEQELAVRMRAKGKITTPGRPFEASDKTEIDGLLANGTLVLVKYDAARHAGTRVFKTRLVREVKSKLDSPYEKSRLVV